ncbi:Flp pilus assembly protein CpaB [Pseudarthrobacter defluvii]|jgi:pilus assembly protein CpaB|uniref:Flp pilus assembly protein CpaB n=1 Tax=Pseudarthrobacter defluvii TaxID=410837 RepID=UPI00257916CB|nr:RcpC/CpaB family pilus assembly protein [Pseudarthrobacter defluvii]WJH23438.1 Flp pilus assembly protein CpaB [Pseudarthrobacter defluvii]
MKARLLGGIAALVVAVIGTVLLFNYVQGADRRALANTETEDVLVVKQNVPAGTPASQLAQYVATKAVPRSAVAADGVHDLSSLGSTVTSVALVPGEQLLSSRLVDANAYLGPSRVAVPAGLQEITLRLGIERVVGGKIQAGDTVGVFISMADSAGGGNGTQLTFHKVLVTAVQFSSGAAAQTQAQSTQGSSSGALNAASENKPATSDSYLITFARNAIDTEKLVYAAEFGKVYLSKEPADATEGTDGVVNQTKVFK